MRKWFPSEFTWRLYVVLQVGALIAFACFVVAFIASGELFKYRSVYEEVHVDLAEVKAKCAQEPETDIDRWLERDSAKKLQDCIDRETHSLVGEELVGVDFRDVTWVLMILVFAFLVPFAVVRVPNWLWEGWRLGSKE